MLSRGSNWGACVQVATRVLTAHSNSPNGLTRVNAIDLLSQLCIFAQQELRTVPPSVVAVAASRDVLAALRAGLLTQAARALKVDTGLSKDRAAGILIMLAQWLVNNPVRFSRSPSHMCTEYVFLVARLPAHD